MPQLSPCGDLAHNVFRSGVQSQGSSDLSLVDTMCKPISVAFLDNLAKAAHPYGWDRGDVIGDNANYSVVGYIDSHPQPFASSPGTIPEIFATTRKSQAV
ncbi:MAG TPA: hypothetical protein V6D19_08065 [Stenomitos sp.]